MKKYFATLRLGWLDALEYRTEFFVSVLGWGIRLAIALFLWIAVAKSKGGQIGNYSLDNIIRYFFIVQIISGFTFSRVGFDIANDIYRGDFGNFLLKPINYILFRMGQEMSKNIFRTVLALVIFGTILIFTYGGVSIQLWKVPFITLSIVGSYLLNFCLVGIIALSSFWIINAMRLMFIYFGILTIFSGMILPIDLFPPNIISLFQFLPFQYIFFFPAHIIQTTDPMQTITQGLFIQWLYILGLGLIVAFMYKQGVKRFEAVGR